MDTSLSSVSPFPDANMVGTKNLDSVLWKENNPSSAFRVKEKPSSVFVCLHGTWCWYMCILSTWRKETGPILA